ncbi:RNA-binding domain-containing protein [Mesomycoplasma neurolyticum]|uniref:Divergent AAA domain n=1 Tax=Mesomycoplasma neurolyticum TaxID=2120 RepID=A0A449A5J1_9BACT|nr:RNA-binding domain-containing protein [Mesomycoplasma neurolyticum]VEU59494.1 Divergent AAA domain [Mesomycoplasma neurolyticum]
MNLETKIKKLIKKGEQYNIEFKESKTSLPEDVFKTVCAFNNRLGGHIILGVNDKKEIIGVEESNIDDIKKNFVTTINNPTAFNPPLYLEPIVLEINNFKIIYIYVPEGKRVCNYKRKIYDRINDSNLDITNSHDRISKIYLKKSNISFVENIYPDIDINSLGDKTIEKVKKMAIAKNPFHIWKNMSKVEMLRSLSLISFDLEQQKESLTLAAILLFGKKETISSILSYYKTDAILRIENTDRYDDRETIELNLIESYYKLVQFGQKHLNDIFVLDKIQNVSARDTILREIVANTLAHRDYSSSFVAKIIIEKDKIIVENSNIPNSFGELKPKKFAPFPKNPLISKVFKEIGFADELGSGVNNIYKYTQIYSQNKPIFEEGETFKTIIPLRDIAISKIKFQNFKNDKGILHKKTIKSNEINKIIEMIKNNKHIKLDEIANKLKLSKKTIHRHIKNIPNLIYIGRGRNGYWQFIDTKK